MHRRTPPALAVWRRLTRTTATALLLAAAGGTAAQTAAAQNPNTSTANTLVQAFELAWSRQPEVSALAARRMAAQAQRQAAQAWTPEPVALELSTKTDRPGRNLGTREYEVGVSVPLWLRGERSLHQAVAEAEARAIDSRSAAARLRLAAGVREAWWGLQRAHAESDAARAQLDNTRAIAADVGKRLRAGDLAQADHHQAEGAVAAAQAAVAQADAALAAARSQLSAWTALPAPSALVPDTEPEPESKASGPAGNNGAHAELTALNDKLAIAQSTASLAAVQTRANPELAVAITRDRGAFGEPHNQTVSVGLRIPLGAGPRHEARTAAARAEALELQAQASIERARLAAELTTAQARTEAARMQLTAADRRAQLAQESRGFFDKSFRLGETDLPTRLRIEAEAADASRQAARARIELAAAISAWRQALGLLPQ